MSKIPSGRGVVTVAVACCVAVPALAMPAAATAAPTGDSRVAARSADPVTPPIPAKYLEQKLTWTKCDFSDGMQEQQPSLNETLCAMVTVPMDWANPGAHKDIQVAIAYTKASGTSKGVVTSNPGGPGGPGLGLTRQLAVAKPQLATDFDLLSFDPRGFGKSTTANCVATQREIDALPRVTDSKELTPATFPAQEAFARFYAKACSANELAEFVNTQQTVYDMELLRRLVQADKLNYVGYSYGTWLGSWYADTYPQHVGRFILDSNTEFTGSMQRVFHDLQAEGFERRRDDSLFPWIARHHGQFGLGTTALTVRVNYDRIRAGVARLAKQNPDAPSPELLDGLVAQFGYVDQTLPIAAAVIVGFQKYVANPQIGEQQITAFRRQAEAKGTYSPLDLQLRVKDAQRVASLDEGDPDALVDLGGNMPAVMCNDSVWSTDLSWYKAHWLNYRNLYPFIGYSFGISQCAFWPYNGHASRTIDLAGSPRMLMFQSEADPATPYRGALSAHLKTPKATRLVSVNDEGQHALWGALGGRCIERIGDDFLFDGAMPRTDTVCGTIPLPGETRVFPFVGGVVGGQHEAPLGS